MESNTRDAQAEKVWRRFQRTAEQAHAAALLARGVAENCESPGGGLPLRHVGGPGRHPQRLRGRPDRSVGQAGMRLNLAFYLLLFILLLMAAALGFISAAWTSLA